MRLTCSTSPERCDIAACPRSLDSPWHGRHNSRVVCWLSSTPQSVARRRSQTRLASLGSVLLDHAAGWRRRAGRARGRDANQPRWPHEFEATPSLAPTRAATPTPAPTPTPRLPDTDRRLQADSGGRCDERSRRHPSPKRSLRVGARHRRTRSASSSDGRSPPLFRLSPTVAADPKTIEALIGALSDADPDVREMVVVTLGRMRDPRIVAALLPLLKDGNADVREQAVFALARTRRCTRDRRDRHHDR